MKNTLLLLIACSSISLMAMDYQKQIIPLGEASNDTAHITPPPPPLLPAYAPSAPPAPSMSTTIIQTSKKKLAECCHNATPDCSCNPVKGCVECMDFTARLAAAMTCCTLDTLCCPLVFTLRCCKDRNSRYYNDGFYYYTRRYICGADISDNWNRYAHNQLPEVYWCGLNVSLNAKNYYLAYCQ